MSDFIRQLGSTDLMVSALGLGTVKFGRNTDVKYPTGFSLPDDSDIKNLLACARNQGINFLDTAPAYGSSEERLGKLIERREDWVICTKTGEEYSNGQSHFDFSPEHTRKSIERSLQRLKTDYLDLVLIHSDGNDLDILGQSDCVDALIECQELGLVRYIGMSTKTEEGGKRAAEILDVVMLTWNLQQQDKAALAQARRAEKGVLVKKGLMSGHASGGQGIQESFNAIFEQQGVHSAIVGTLNPAHLEMNCELARNSITRSAKLSGGV